jgi:hypothetical protein
MLFVLQVDVHIHRTLLGHKIFQNKDMWNFEILKVINYAKYNEINVQRGLNDFIDAGLTFDFIDQIVNDKQMSYLQRERLRQYSKEFQQSLNI